MFEKHINKQCIYLCNLLIKITTATKLEDDKLYGIKGFITNWKIIKSRSAESGRTRDMVYSQVNGFDNELSLLEFLKSNGYLLGGGVSYKIKGLEGHTFRLSNFKEKLLLDEELKYHFHKTAQALLEAAIPISNRLVAEPKQEELEKPQENKSEESLPEDFNFVQNPTDQQQ